MKKSAWRDGHRSRRDRRGNRVDAYGVAVDTQCVYWTDAGRGKVLKASKNR